MDGVQWPQILQAAILVLASVCLVLFAVERRRIPPPSKPSLSAIFSNPYLRILGILLMVLVALQPTADASAEGPGAWLPSLGAVVVFIIGATVAGADFILLFVALLKNNEVFIKEHFALERARMVKASEPVHISPEEVPALAVPARDKGLQDRPPQPLQLEAFYPMMAQEAMEQLGIMKALDLVNGGREVRVAVVSTGIEPSLLRHPVFAGSIEPPYVATGALPGKTGDPGAASLGFLRAIAPTARIFPISVFDDSYVAHDEIILEGLAVAVRWAPHVILLEFGGSSEIKGLRQLVGQYADSILFVAPAGNNGDDRRTWPAALEQVIGVAAATPEGRLTGFSSFGRGVELAAPGENLVSLFGTRAERLRFRSMSGTSMAAGLVTAVVALALATSDQLLPSALIGALKSTGHPVSGHRSIRRIDAAALVSFVLGNS